MSTASSPAAADHSSDDDSGLSALLDQGLQSTSSSTSPSSTVPIAQEPVEQAEQPNKRRRVGEVKAKYLQIGMTTCILLDSPQLFQAQTNAHLIRASYMECASDVGPL